MARPKTSNLASRELERLDGEFQAFQDQVKEMSESPKEALKTEESEEQTKMTKQAVREYDAPVIKPKNSIGSKEKFDSVRFGKLREQDEEYIKVIVENKEVIGESVHLWHKEFPGQDCTEHEIPVNRPVYIWRGVAKQIGNKCKYKRLMMNEQDPLCRSAASSGFTAGLVAESLVTRIDCRKVENF